MKKTTKIIVSLAVAIALVGAVLAVTLIKNKKKNDFLLTSTTYPVQNTIIQPTTQLSTNAWVNWQDFLTTTAIDPSALSGIAQNPTAATGVPGQTVIQNGVVTSIVYVYPTNMNTVTQIVTAQPITEPASQGVTEPPVTEAQMIPYKYTINKSANAVTLDRYTGDDTTPDVPETVNGYNVTTIAAGCFKDKKITTLYIPKTITSIGDNAFSGCKSLKTLFFKGNEAVTIGNGAFYNCTSLQTIVLSIGTTKLGDNCFSNCKSLSKITIPANVTEIGAGAFSNCAAGLVITCEEGSVAHQTAEQYNIKYKLM